MYLTKSGQNVDFWTFCNHDEGINESRKAAKFLKIKRINFYFSNKIIKSKNRLYFGSQPSQFAKIKHLFLDFGLSISS